MPANRLVIVSNRLPISATVSETEVSFTQASGGLATGLRGCHERSGGLWIGWPGSRRAVRRPAPRARRSARASAASLPCTHARRGAPTIYEGFSNGVLWPLFHYLLDRLPLDATGVGDLPARSTSGSPTRRRAQYRPGDLIWVHDYQLMLVPGDAARAQLPDARIGFFLHIPFPSAGGVPHPAVARSRCSRAARRRPDRLPHVRRTRSTSPPRSAQLLGVEPDVDGVVARRIARVRFGVFPMGIDARAFARARARRRRRRRGRAICRRRPAAARSCSASIGSTTRRGFRGGCSRSSAAAARAALRGQVRLVQVAVPSREEVRRVPASSAARSTRWSAASTARYGTVDRRADPLPVSVGAARAAGRALPRRRRDAGDAAARRHEPRRQGVRRVARRRRRRAGAERVRGRRGGAAGSAAGEPVRRRGDRRRDASARSTCRPPSSSARMRALRARVVDLRRAPLGEHFIDTLAERAAGRPARDVGSGAAATRSRGSARRAPLAILLDYDGTLVPIADTPERGAARSRTAPAHRRARRRVRTPRS